MRERSTWNRDKIKKAAAETAGDIYTMNQDHPQPSHDKYVIGDPSDFAEDVHSPNEWEKEYSGEEVKRNEIGMPEMRQDTFNHSEKTASRETLLKKANLCVEIASMMLAGKRVASEQMIEDQAFSLMFLPAQELIDTHTRLAQQQEVEEVEEMDEPQDKQAGEMPDFIKEKIEEKEESKDQGEKKEAGELPPALKEHMEEKKSQGGEEAPAQEQGEKQAAQEGLKDVKNEGGEQNDKANNNWPTKEAAQDMMAQMQSMMAQLQQMMQQGQGQMPQQAPVMADDLDQMLAQDSCGPMAESDIQMEPAPMDVMASDEDEVLRNLFANDEEMEVEQADEADQQAKQANVVRTASSRTVGTRPSAGVAKLGGGVQKQASSTDVDQLSSLWSSAPDVTRFFK